MRSWSPPRLRKERSEPSLRVHPLPQHHRWRTPRSRLEDRKAHAKYGRPVIGFLQMTSAQHIEQALKELRALESPTVEGMRMILAAYRELEAAYRELDARLRRSGVE